MSGPQVHVRARMFPTGPGEQLREWQSFELLAEGDTDALIAFAIDSIERFDADRQENAEYVNRPEGFVLVIEPLPAPVD